MKYPHNLLLILSMLLTLAVCGQNTGLATNNKKAIKHYRQAEIFMRQQKYTEAESSLTKALEKDPKFKEAMLLIGDAYREQRKLGEAISIYERLISADSLFYTPVYYFLGNLYLDDEQYDKAISAYNYYFDLEINNPEQSMSAKSGYQRAIFSKKATENPIDTKIFRLNAQINSNNDEYINFVSEDESSMIFTRKDKNNNIVSGSSYREYFIESMSEGSCWQEAHKIKIPDIEGNTGGMTLSFDGKQMYFTACNWPDSKGGCDIYTSSFVSGEWSKPYPLGSNINSKAWDSQASISADGENLYFSSRRAGGKGGSDIWKSIKLEGGRWSKPVNLGDSINSPGDEMAPYIHPDGKTLYYSSNGSIGMGGFDIFISRKDITGIWSKGTNIGYPINTKYDEINIFPALIGNKAWISSNREDSTLFDIFTFNLPGEISPDEIVIMKGKVIDSKNKKPISAKIEITDIENGKIFSTSRSDAADGKFISVLFPLRRYAFNISSKGYLFYSGKFIFEERSDSRKNEKVFELKRIKSGISANLNNVYFDTDKWELKKESFAELDKLYKLLTNTPDIQIVIQGYTDNSGTEEHNLELSQKRAKSVMEYLISHGISAKRLSSEGLGSGNPIADNTTEQGRALNRRTVIIVK
jgi:flagellar motor protein MotB/Tfp pilus assembly protein PilF